MATALTQILVRAGETSREGGIISMQSFIYKNFIIFLNRQVSLLLVYNILNTSFYQIRK